MPAFDFAAFDFGAFDASLPGPSAHWRPILRFGGVDLSAALVGEIRIEAGEDAARIAEFSLALTAGASVTLPAYVGQPVEIEFADAAPTAPGGRLFTGVVDLPSYDPDARAIRFRCTDDLPGQMAALSAAAIATLTGGYWSPVLFDQTPDGWQTARDYMSTVPAALDLTPTGFPRVTPWAAKATADLDFDADTVIDGSLTPELANRSALRNQVTVTFSYRFPVLKHRLVRTAFDVIADYVATPAGAADPTFAGFLLTGAWFPSREAVRTAATGTGWTIRAETFTAVPPSGAYYTSGSDPVMWAISDADAALLCFGWSLDLSRHYGQWTDEVYTVTVSNTESVSRMGALPEARAYTLAVDFDVNAWEAAANAPATDTGATPDIPGPSLPLSSPGEALAIWAPDAATDRAAATATLEAIVAQAKVTIIGSHRQSSVHFATPLDPRADLDKTVRVVSGGVTAQGKVRAVTHRMDVGSGEAISEIEVAVASVAGLGIPHPDDPVAAPPPSTPATPPGADLTCTSAFEWDYSAAEHAVTVTAPAIESLSRDHATVPIAQAYAAGFTEDEFVLTTV